MFDRPHQKDPNALKEMSDLSLETRRHLHGLFERLSEGMIILILQLTVVLLLIFTFPGIEPETFKGWGLLAVLVYIGFSVFWALRSVSPIHAKLRQSFTKEEIAEGKTYERYCMGGWFMRTVGGLIFATFLLCGIVYAIN